MRDCIIIGAGDYGQVWAELLKKYYNILGFYDDDKSLIGSLVNGYKVLGNVKDALVGNSFTSVFVPIGNNKVRYSIIKIFEANGFNLPSFIHPETFIDETVKLGKAVYILPGTHIMPLSVIGDYVMISMGVNIAHHTIISQACFFSMGSNIGASISIDEYAYIGTNATLMTGIKKIGKNCLVGAGAVVTRDVPENAVVAGVPAKVLRFQLSD